MKYVMQHDDGSLALVETPYEIEESGLEHPGPKVQVADDFQAEDLAEFQMTAGKLKRKAPPSLTWSKTHVVADLADQVLISGLPEGTLLFVKTTVEDCCPERTYLFEVDDGTAELVFSEPGEYEVTMRMCGHKTIRRTIHAV